MRLRRSKSLLAIAIAASFVLAACGDDDDDAADTAAPVADTAAPAADTTVAADTTAAADTTVEDSTDTSAAGTAGGALAGICPETDGPADGLEAGGRARLPVPDDRRGLRRSTRPRVTSPGR